MVDDAVGSHSSWDIAGIDTERELIRLNDMADSLVARHVKQVIVRMPHSCSSLEIGSGLGKMSFYAALLGAEVNLLDSSSHTLDSAKQLYNACGLQAVTHEQDALCLPESLKNKFNLSLSLGVNEHFSGQARQLIFNAHFDVLKQGGYSVVAVPNRHSLSYRIAMFIWRITGRWPDGLYEYGFSKAELEQRMKHAGFTDVKVVSATFARSDFNYFIVGNLKAALRKFGLIKNVKGSEEAKDSIPSVNDIRTKITQASPPDIFCNNQSYTWVATGKKD